MSAPDFPSGEPPHSVLLLAPGFGDGADHACTDLLADSGAPNVLYVSYAGDPSDRRKFLAEHADTSATARAVVVGEGSDGGNSFETVETVAAPTDLTGLGIAINEQLEAAERDTAVCFDSVTSLLQYVDVDTAYEFLHVVLGRLYSHDALGHLHMDPSAHDDAIVERITSLVDGRVRLSEDGAIEEVRAPMRNWEA